MRTIFKFPLNTSGKTVVEMPRGSAVLSVLNQGETLVAYAIVDPDETTKEPVTFQAAMTGHPLVFEKPGALLVDCEFVGTVAFDGGSFIVHVFVVS